MTKNFYLAIYLSLCMLVGLAPNTLAQARQAGVQGTIQDETGAVLVGATVTVRNLQTNLSRSVACDDWGHYELARLDEGDYEVQALMPGFSSQVQELTVNEGEISTLDITLRIAPYAETVKVTRTDQELSAVPQAVGVIPKDEIQFAQRKVSPAESLRAIPGLFGENRNNFSMSGGVRLSIRAPVPRFGMRGLQIVQDGIPLTTADGTTQPTNIDLGSTGRVDVIRGPSSVLYGNSAGGVIDIRTELPSSRALLVQPDIQFGSYGYDRQQVKTSGTSGGVGYLVNLTRMHIDGYRDYSSAETRQANVTLGGNLSPATEIRGVFSLFDMPFGENSSTLNLDDAQNNPTSVRQLAIDQGWGESATQGQGGVTLKHQFGGGQVLQSTGWALWRNVWNPIPFQVIDLGRVGAGFRSEYGGSNQLGSLPVTWTTGLDISYQRDDRNEFGNEGIGEGGEAQEGDLQVDQLETVLSLGPFAQVTFAPSPRWKLTAGLRYDYFDFEANDRFLANGDHSGGRKLDAFSPMVGVTYLAAQGFNLYSNFATAYQTPTTVELSNRPSGEGGFNTDLEPEDLRSFEVGFRGLVEPWQLQYGLAGYISNLKNALVPYQRPDEQIFFRNAGESSRNGIELFLEWKPLARLRTRLAYTYQDFEFVEFVTESDDFSGMQEPGAPPHRVFTEITYETAFGLRSTLQYQWVDAYPVNSANTFYNWSYQVVDLRFGIERRWKQLDILPFFGVDNLFNERYNASILPNAIASRFYEPSPDRALYFGIRLGAGTQ